MMEKSVRSQRVLVMMNEYALPPTNIDPSTIDRDSCEWIMQYDVMSHLKKLNFDVQALGLSHDLKPLQDCIQGFDPHIVFNLIYEFAGESIFDQNIIAYLELLGVPFTGSNPRSLMLARDKGVTKKILTYHNVPTPNFLVYEKGQPIAQTQALRFPVIVKCLTEDASLGISLASLVTSEDKLVERVQNIHERYNCHAIAEEFIDGREISVGVIGNGKLTSLPPWELVFENSLSPEREFYHGYAKWNNAYRARKGIRSKKAELDKKTERAISQLAKKSYQALGLKGYARIDFRLNAKGELFVIEANPSPDLSRTEDFAMAAQEHGIDYETLIGRIVHLGLRSA